MPLASKARMGTDLQRRPMQAFGLAILIEAVLLVAAAGVVASTMYEKPAISEPVPIVLVSEDKPPPEPPLPEPPKPLPPLPKPLPRPLVKLTTPPPLPVPPPAAPIQAALV